MNDAGAPIPDIVEIEHRFFKAFDDPYFRLSAPPNEKPIFCAKLGEQEVSLPLDGIIRELALEEDNPLRIMIQTIGKSLKFVTVLQFGDEVPAEIRNGDASWETEAKHFKIAQQKLTMQLVTWASGRESRVTDPEELQQFFDDPATKQKTNDAFSKAAEQLGLKDSDEVVKMVEDFALDLSYIEALRERFVQIVDLSSKLATLRKSYSQKNKLIDEIDPVLRLIKKPVADFRSGLEKVDVLTDAIITTLRQLDVGRERVRDIRNDLYVRIESWREIIDLWTGINPLDLQQFDAVNAVRNLHRFLAQRYLEVDEWVLLLKDNSAKGNGYGGVMTW
jgi:hypothetical protein